MLLLKLQNIACFKSLVIFILSWNLFYFHRWNQDTNFKTKSPILKKSRAEKIRVSALTLDDSYLFESTSESQDICPEGFEAAVNGMYCTGDQNKFLI